MVKNSSASKDIRFPFKINPRLFFILFVLSSVIIAFLLGGIFLPNA